MTHPASEHDILRGIIEIIKDQQKLERHQRSSKASPETLPQFTSQIAIRETHTRPTSLSGV